jgi:hypothetical protein
LISESIQKIENGYECRDTEKSERFAGPRFQAPMEIEVDTPATERIEGIKDDFRTGPRGVRSLPTIRMEDIERPDRKKQYLR